MNRPWAVATTRQESAMEAGSFYLGQGGLYRSGGCFPQSETIPGSLRVPSSCLYSSVLNVQWGIFWGVRNVGQTVQSAFFEAKPCLWTDRLDSLFHAFAFISDPVGIPQSMLQDDSVIRSTKKTTFFE